MIANNASTSTAASTSTSTSILMKKVLRTNMPMIPKDNISLSISKMLKGIVNNVILSSLLGYVNSNTTTPTLTTTTAPIHTVMTPVIATHERRAIVMLLLQKINNIVAFTYVPSSLYSVEDTLHSTTSLNSVVNAPSITKNSSLLS